MSLHFFVDGYNAVRCLPAFDVEPLAESRRRLCAYLEGRRPHGSARNKVTVVFDGQAAVGTGGREPWSFEVLYSVGMTADDLIQKRVREAPQPKNCVVVTDDKGLAAVVKRSGASVRNVADFFKGARTEKAQRFRLAAAGSAADRASLDIVTREKITQEMGRVWLKKK
jgi:predicted RNA-binding protein with PIN domain